MRRLLYFIWTQVWLTGVVGLVLLALYTSLGRQLIPLIETQTENIEEILSTQLGLPVAIGSLEGDWVWFSPVVNANNITWGETENKLYAKHLEAELDVSASLFYRSLVFKRITLDGVTVSIQQHENLSWQIGQFSFNNPKQSNENKTQESNEKPLWLELLTQQGELHLLNWQVDVQAFDADNKKLELIDLRLRNKGLQHWLDGEVRLGGAQGAILKTQLEVEGDLWEFNESNGRGYVELEPRAWESWIPIKDKDFHLERLTAGGKVWVEIEQGLLHALDGYLEVPKYLMTKKGTDQQQELSLENGRIILAGRRDKLDWHLWFNTEGNWLSELAPPLPKGRLSYLADFSGSWQLELQDLELEPTAVLVEKLELLPKIHTDFVVNLKPKGTAKKLHINIIPEQNFLWGAKIELADTNVVGWNGIPTLRKINALVELNAARGKTTFSNNDTFLHFPKLYPEGWELSDLSSQIFWQIEKDYVRLVAPKIKADYPQANKEKAGELAGGFSLYIPRKNSLIEPRLDLSLGFKYLDIQAQKKFMPPAALPELSNWLSSNIYSGEINEGSFIYSGYSGPDAPEEALTLQLYLDIEDGRLTYLEDWPQVTDVKAKIMLDSPTTNIWLHSAKTLGGEFITNSGHIRIRKDENSIPWMTIKGEIQGSAQEGLEYLQTTPLRENVGGVFDQWHAAGKQLTKLYARIPLAQPEVDDNIEPSVDTYLKPKIRLTSELDDVDLNIKDFNLQVNNIVGQLKFDSDVGISAEELVANIFGGRIVSRISSENIGGAFDINIAATGKGTAEKLKQWQPLFLLEPMSGELNYTLDAGLKPLSRGGTTLTLSSDLVGIEVDAPIPFGKTAESVVPFQFSIKHTHDMRFTFNYGKWANGVVALENGSVKRGQIYLGETKAYLPSDDGLRVNGNIPVEVDAKAWWELWQKIKPIDPVDLAKEDVNGINEKTSILTHVDISVAQVNSWQQLMGPSHIVGDYKWGQWELDLTSNLVKGKIEMPDGDKPMTLTLDYIHMPVSDDLPDEDIKFGSALMEDSLINVEPSLIPEMNLKVEEVFLGTSNFGRWDMTITQEDTHTKIHVNDSLTKALKVQGDINWHKNENGHKTHLELMRISSKDLGDTQRAFRKSAAVESKSSRFDIDMRWDGSPAKFNYATLNGLAKISIKEGVLVSDNTGGLKAFGVLNFNSIRRRLQLDFSDLYESGVVFDSLKARMVIKDGVATFADPLVVDSPSAKFQSSGSIDLNTDVVDQKMIVTFPITSSLPMVAVLAGLAPAIAGAIYVTEKLIGEELEKFTSASYSITGTLENPKLTIDKAFDNELDGKESRSMINRFLDIFGLGDD
jgi:uncharacterized protein (TIGR02099 family)